MVCNRCVKVVKEEIEKLGYSIENIKLGEVELREEENLVNKVQLKEVLESNGFELLDDRKTQLVEKIKNVIVELIHHSKDHLKTNVSEYISQKVGSDYSNLSNLFSSVEGITIEKYLILQRIERAKELLVYDELTLSEIAFELGYSSVAHLSAQFKKTTGLTPSHFKKLSDHKRMSLDHL
ncbi:AraC-type DNA-binding protein [Solitalea koreensis]|uniref:AraC-type DNA-binding protein n=2 Tax=Solitalea koreensis TaxID=543615 RepID=A0A521DB69_9SPHI|nr:AraC-type DNA-binding protein [Solitalea koreensis]